MVFLFFIIGFVPKNQHYFGKRYAENCTNAASDFENDQRKHNQKIQDLRVTEALQAGKVCPTDGGSGLPVSVSRVSSGRILRAKCRSATFQDFLLFNKPNPNISMSIYFSILFLAFLFKF